MSFSKRRGLPQGISKLRALNALARADTINLGLGKPFVDMPEELRDLAISVLKRSQDRLDYSENAGLESTRNALEQYYGLPKGSTLLTHGAQEALFAAMLAHLNPGDEILLPNPGFLAYETMAEIVGARVKFYPLLRIGSNFHYDMENILGALTKKTKMVLLCSPGNPTGSQFLHTRELAKALAKKSIWLLMDEVYGELLFSGEYKPSFLSGKNIISVNAFSKSHALTGWRIGWIGAQDKGAWQRCLVAHQYLATCASVPAQRLVEAILGEPELSRRIISGFRREYQEKSRLFLRACSFVGAKWEPPKAGFYFFLPLPAGEKSSAKFCERILRKENILLVPGEYFGSAGKKFYRLSFSASRENLQFAAGKLSSYY